jgi:hypothetical protein
MQLDRFTIDPYHNFMYYNFAKAPKTLANPYPRTSTIVTRLNAYV